MSRNQQQTKEKSPEEAKLIQFGEIMYEVGKFDPERYTAILRSVEFRQGEKPIDYVERMQIFAGPPLMKMAIANVINNPTLSAKIFMFFWEPVVKKQGIDLTVKQQRPIDMMSDEQVMGQLINELWKHPASRRMIEDKMGGGNNEEGNGEG